MKKLLVMLAMLMSVAGIKAQDAKDKPKETKSDTAATKADIENVLKKMNELFEKSKPQTETYGYFIRKSKAVIRKEETFKDKKGNKKNYKYSPDGNFRFHQIEQKSCFLCSKAKYTVTLKALESVTIERITMVIKEGYIDHIDVKTSNGLVFSNGKSMISIPQFKQRLSDKLYAETEGTPYEGQSLYFKLADVLSLATKYPNKYIPADDDNIILEDKNDSCELKMQYDIDYLTSLRFNTDFIGLSNKDNPILQTELNSRFILNTQNMKNRRCIWFNFLEPYVVFNKFDSKFDTLKSKPNTENDSLSRMDLWRKSNFISGVKLNVWSHYAFINLAWNVGLQYNQIRNVYLRDSVDDKINLYSLYSELRFIKENNKAFGYNTGIKFYLSNAFSRPRFDNNNPNFLIGTDAEVFWKPDVKKRSNVFFRFFMYNNLSQKERNTVQLQLGYNASFNDWFKKQTAGN